MKRLLITATLLTGCGATQLAQREQPSLYEEQAQTWRRARERYERCGARPSSDPRHIEMHRGPSGADRFQIDNSLTLVIPFAPCVTLELTLGTSAEVIVHVVGREHTAWAQRCERAWSMSRAGTAPVAGVGDWIEWFEPRLLMSLTLSTSEADVRRVWRELQNHDLELTFCGRVWRIESVGVSAEMSPDANLR